MATKSTSVNRPWFEASEKDAPAIVFERVRGLRAGPLASYRKRVRRNMQLYAGSLNVNGVEASDPAFRVRYNLIRAVVGTGVAVLSAARTLPFGMTRGASWKLRRKTAKFNATIQQQFASIGVFNNSLQVIQDACVGGLGALRFFADPSKPGGQVSCERALPLSVVWDPAEAAIPSGVTQLWQISLINRDVLAKQHPKFATQIADAQGPSSMDHLDFALKVGGTRADQVVVIEAWHLPSSDEARDGWYGRYTSNATLCAGEWATPRFPFGFKRGWEPNQLGFSGVSMVELAEPAQLEIEQAHDYADACRKLGSKPTVFVEGQSNVDPDEIDNLPMRIVRYTGAKPTLEVFNATPQDLPAFVDRVREQTLHMFGLNAQQVQGQVPQGINSAVGQRTAEDIQSKRHTPNIRDVEAYYLECSWGLIDANNMLLEDEPGFEIDSAARGAWLESSKWSEIRPSATEAQLAVLPIAALVGSPSAFYQTVAEWVQLGRVSPQTAKLLEGMPDTEGQTDDDTEDQSYAAWLCDRIDDGEIVSVDPYVDVVQVLPLVRTQYLSALRQKADPEVLTQYRRTLDTLKARTQAAAPAATPAPAPTGEVQLPGAAA